MSGAPGTGVANAVSAYPTSAAIRCIRVSSSPSASSTTPAGFPPSGVAAKAL